MNGNAYEPYDISARRRAFDRAFVRGLERGQAFLAEHWLFLLNATAALFVGLAALSPLLIAAGLEPAGGLIFAAYKYACHQLPYRSFFIAGHQMAFCERDAAIYAAITLAGLFYATRRRRVRPLKFWVYLLLITPMAIDGFTQLFGWRESNWELRVITGVLFGVASVWFLYPYIESSVDELRKDALGTPTRRDEAVRLTRERG